MARHPLVLAPAFDIQTDLEGVEMTDYVAVLLAGLIIGTIIGYVLAAAERAP